ncbi:hypothetical protein ULMS_05840 [Patiriisocius marinistellae]|uniref:histidine kinase n=1 Tax=Patiriisocius marinistellae TaxID=2494560 RepID=A0A5J4FY87_9FLAO|nr:hybrid sensor histidine kinase/response regulator [Patiriisocius marinistellae]GEQ85076.1 hypothetical protein ULMS_05840 [Patiriisocius marinistellae]
MSLQEIKNSLVSQKIQILQIDSSTTIKASDNTICNIEIGKSLTDIDPFFYSLEHVLTDNFETIKYPCVNINTNNKDYIFDIDVFKKESAIYVLLIDFTEHYTEAHPLVQEKNEAQIEKNRLSFEGKLLYAKEVFKNNFLSHLNHEVRNPLNNLLGFVDVLMDTNLDFQQKEYVNVINKTGLHIKFLMDDLLDISKIETGALELKQIPFNLIQIVVNIAKHFQTKYRDSSIELIYNLDKKVPQKLIGDPTRLNQIFYNLLENAFLNTKEGIIEINVLLIKNLDKTAEIAFEIKDTGTGIPKNKIKEVFESYSQLQLSKIKPIGQGLGLKIVKDLSIKMGGNVTVKSTENKGSIFTVVLPFKTREKNDRKKTVPKGSGLVISKKILAIEEDQTSQMLLMKQFLENDEGFILELAKNGTQAKELLNKKNYAAVILKSQLEDMNAQSLIDYINNHAKESVNKVPVIVATGNTMINERYDILESGASAFLAKPYSKKDLFKILKEL